ncbi:hypothetical protein PQX77_015784 [Marasmius sp. AFHP31]|nr:hypothetical protein PQX77_015784 [Marasmius sp. AFHP31]
MPSNYRYVHPVLKEEIKSRIYEGDKQVNVAHSSEVSKNMVSQLKKRMLGQDTGKRTGRPRILNSLDVAYLKSLIEHTPDIYLCELQDKLLKNRNINVTPSTIRNTLL